MDAKKGHVHEVSESELREKLGDKRTTTRYTAELAIDVPLENWAQAKRVLTTNISQGGLLFTLPSPASIAASIDLVLELPNGDKVTLPARCATSPCAKGRATSTWACSSRPSIPRSESTSKPRSSNLPASATSLYGFRTVMNPHSYRPK